MTKRRPGYADIGGVRYSLEWYENPPGDEKQQKVYGFATYSEQRIVLAACYPLDRQKAALLHELIHAVSAEFFGDKGLSEREVITLASGLAGAIGSNPEIGRFLALRGKK